MYTASWSEVGEMILKKISFALLILFFGLCICHADAARPLSIDDYYKLKDVSDVRISPDGKWVAYELSGIDEKADHSYTNLYMAPIGGGDAVQLTFSGKDEHPRWSPDNRQLAFLSSRNDKESQVYLLNRDGGEAYPITDIEQGIEDFQWSPDGKKMLLVVTDPDADEAREDEKKAPPPYVITRLFFKFDGLGYLKELFRHLYVLDVKTREMKQITHGPYDDASQRQSDSDFPNPPQWSPDGKQILFVSNRTKEPDSNTNTDLFVVPADGGEPKKLTTNEGPDQMPAWSPDGKSIVYVTSVEPKYLWFDQMKIATIPAGGGTPRILTSGLDRNTWEPHFGKDGRLYFIVEDHGTQRIVSMRPGDETISEVTPEKSFTITILVRPALLYLRPHARTFPLMYLWQPLELHIS
jgi:Tol biopolymer transport system component